MSWTPLRVPPPSQCMGEDSSVHLPLFLPAGWPVLCPGVASSVSPGTALGNVGSGRLFTPQPLEPGSEEQHFFSLNQKGRSILKHPDKAECARLVHGAV